jgi:hypothetical protein
MLKSGARRTSCTLEKVDSTAAIVRNRVPGSHRFRQAAVPGFWRDEEAVAGSRSGPGQRAARLAARKGIFRDCRLRVAALLPHYA